MASSFTTFYEQCPVLNAPGEAVRDSRLALSALTLRVLDTGLGLLGIPVPERMSAGAQPSRPPRPPGHPASPQPDPSEIPGFAG